MALDWHSWIQLRRNSYAETQMFWRSSPFDPVTWWLIRPCRYAIRFKFFGTFRVIPSSKQVKSTQVNFAVNSSPPAPWTPLEIAFSWAYCNCYDCRWDRTPVLLRKMSNSSRLTYPIRRSTVAMFWSSQSRCSFKTSLTTIGCGYTNACNVLGSSIVQLLHILFTLVTTHARSNTDNRCCDREYSCTLLQTLWVIVEWDPK